MATTRTWTPFVEWQLMPPHPGKSLASFLEPVSRDLLWRELLRLADVPQVGRALFPGPLPSEIDNGQSSDRSFDKPRHMTTPGHS